MLLDSFWRVICLARYYTTQGAVQLLPPPKRSYSSHYGNKWPVPEACGHL